MSVRELIMIISSITAVVLFFALYLEIAPDDWASKEEADIVSNRLTAEYHERLTEVGLTKVVYSSERKQWLNVGGTAYGNFKLVDKIHFGRRTIEAKKVEIIVTNKGVLFSGSYDSDACSSAGDLPQECLYRDAVEVLELALLKSKSFAEKEAEWLQYQRKEKLRVTGSHVMDS